MTVNWSHQTPKKGCFDQEAKNRIIGDRLLAKLEREEKVAFQLTADERDFEFWNCRQDVDFQPLPLSPETLRKIGNNRKLILEALIRAERKREKFTAVLWHWDTDGYRDECREYWKQRTTDSG